MLLSLAIPAALAALPLAFAVSPLLLVRLFAPRARPVDSLAAAGLAGIALNTAVPLALHALAVPITPGYLGAAHILLAAALLLITRIRSRFTACLGMDAPSCSPLLPEAGSARARQARAARTRRRCNLATISMRSRAGSPVAGDSIGADFTPDLLPLAAMALLLAILLFPVTHLTGIDTYKWQDLADNVVISGRIPWLVHARSLFGFTPRSYPSAQPLALATIELLGGMGIDASFYVLSVFNALVGLFGAAALAARLFPGRRETAPFFALAYVFSPVFMRYTYWATGRGMFLAVLPICVLAMLHLPHWRGLLAFPAAALLLFLSHKTAMVAVPLLLISAAVAWALPRRTPRVAIACLLLVCAVAAAALAPRCLLPGAAGKLAGLSRMALSRFGWMTPLALFGLLATPHPLDAPRRNALLAALLLSAPLAFHSEMYGALIALPFVSLFAVDGVLRLKQVLSPSPDAVPGIAGRAAPKPRPVIPLAVALSLLGATVTLVHFALPAMPHRLYKAALFLDAYDPQGPFVVEAPGPYRTPVQAYTSGCPRFEVTARDAAADRRVFPRLPSPAEARTRPANEWIGWLRFLFGLSDVETHWYGRNPRTYYITVDGEGPRGPGPATRIYDRDGIIISAPAGQRPPSPLAAGGERPSE